MEQRDVELIQKFCSQDPALNDLFRQHVEFERELEKLDNKSYLSVDEQMERQKIKKQKLVGKDKIEMILKRYRQKENGN